MHPEKTATATVVLGLLLAFVAPAGLAVAEEPKAPPKLAGSWKLNKSLSDDPARMLMEAVRGGGRDGGGARGTGGMGGPGGGMGGRGGGAAGTGGGRGGSGGRGAGGPGGTASFGGEPPLDGEGPEGEAGSGPPTNQPRRGPAGPRGVAASPVFVIEQEGDSLAFRTDGNLRLLRTDGQKRKREGASGKLDVVGKFEKGALVIESRPETGGKRREAYSILPDGKLQIDFEIDGMGRMPQLKFRLVYEASPVV